MSDGDIGQSCCVYKVGDCLTTTPHPPYTHTYTHTHMDIHSHSHTHTYKKFENIAPQTRVHSQMNAHKLPQVILEYS